MFRRVNLTYRIIDSFFRHARVFVIAIVLVTGTVAGVLLTRNKQYEATASTRVVIDNDLSSVLGVEKRSYTTPAEDKVARFGDLTKDDLPGGFVDTFLKKADLKPPINVSPNAKDPRFATLMKHLNASPDGNNVFTITLIWENKEECERILKSLQQQFIAETGAAKQASSIAISNFLDSQIEVYRRRLQAADQALISYKQTHSGQLPDAQQAEINQLAALRNDRDYLKITSSDNDLKIAALQSRLSEISPTSVMEQTMGQSASAMQIKELEAKKNALIADNYLPSSDMVRQVDEQIARLLPVLQREKAEASSRQLNAASAGTQVTETVLQKNPEYETLTQQLTEATIAQKTQSARLVLLNTKIAEYEGRIQALPAAQRELTERTRDYDIYKKQYEDLRERREQARIKADMDKVAATSTLQPLGVIYAESTVTGKKKAILLVASVFIGLIIATALVVLSEINDNTLRYDTDAERILGVPVLASLPESKSLLGIPGGGASGGSSSRRRLWQRSGNAGTTAALPDAPGAATAASATAGSPDATEVKA